jgi:hypothetical protein
MQLDMPTKFTPKVRLLNLVTTLATDFVNLAIDDIDAAISDALARLGQQADVDRAYV